MRNLINIVTESYLGYAPVLKDAQEIAEYIMSTSSEDVDGEFIEEHFWGCHATLTKVPLVDLAEGNPDGNIRSASKERKYSKMDMATIPPLVVEDGTVVDGNHRYRVAKKNGVNMLWCYVVT